MHQLLLVRANRLQKLHAHLLHCFTFTLFTLLSLHCIYMLLTGQGHIYMLLTLHIVDMHLTCLINITYLLT